jgi:hypothetical protein
LFCSACGKELGTVAHIVNDELLCEDCYSKLDQENQTQNHTVVIGSDANEQRQTATQPVQATAQLELPPSDENALLARVLPAGESVLWKRSFSKGIVHRHLTFTEVVTNMRAMCIDDENVKLAGYIPLKMAEVFVDKEHREYSGVHTGVEARGMYGGTSSGTSVTYGNVNFMSNGRIFLTFFNVRDPNGLKNLINASKKSSMSRT